MLVASLGSVLSTNTTGVPVPISARSPCLSLPLLEGTTRLPRFHPHCEVYRTVCQHVGNILPLRWISPTANVNM